MKKRLGVTLCFVLGLVAGASAQIKLPPNFEYKRETGQETGVPYFILLPRLEAMNYDGWRGSSFEALGSIVQPERDKYGLVYFNAKEQYQFHQQKEKGVAIKIDGEEIKISEYAIGEQRTVGLLKLETAIITIDKKIFEKLVKAKDVIIRAGIVAYNLDEDNIDALHYFAAEINRDLVRRKKTLPK